ncbi:MAG: DsbC family protein [Proteobacteria bacterium]|nr:DsbC family protein [Pseudomonadota bacterium]MDA1063878.1 DsbC family protein [Pseudomonadota bacterium]
METRIQARQSIYFSFVALVTAAAFSTSPVFAADVDSELEQVRQKVTAMFDMIEAKDVNISPVDGWYTIQRGSIVAYISGNGRYLLQGDLVDLEQNINLSEASRNQTRRELMASVRDEDVILFSPAEKKYSVSIFTDVECTYCRRLHSQIDEYLAHGIEVRYLMYPRNGPTSHAWTTAEQVWCAKDRNGALTAAKQDQKFAFSECDASIVESQYQMGQDVGLSGTPAIVLDDGTLISGYLPPDQLRARLDLIVK